MTQPTAPRPPAIPAPTRLSGAIRLALADLAKIEADPRYGVDMGLWHEMWQGKCQVCFAGAVMSITLRTPITAEVFVGDFDEDWRKVFRALDDVRVYRISDALCHLHPEVPSIDRKAVADAVCADLPHRPLIYSANPAYWRENMLYIATELEARNL